MFIVVRLEQPENADPSMDVTPLPKTTEESEVQFSKALLPILVMVLGKVMLVKLEQPLKA